MKNLAMYFKLNINKKNLTAHVSEIDVARIAFAWRSK